MHAAKGPPVANPGPYNTAHHFSSFGSLVEALKRDRKPGSARRVMRKPKSVPLIGMGFPFADERQVAFANAAGDIRRNILPRASALLGGAPPRIHAGASVDKSDRSPQRRAGYAWRGRNDIYLTPDAYMDVPNFARGVALHELAHTRQDPREPSRTKVEGGADWMAEQLAAKLGLSRYEPGYPDLIERYSEELGLPRARPEIRRMLEPLRARLH